MNWIDLIIIIIFGLATIKGLIRGALKTLLYITTFCIAIKESSSLAPWMNEVVLSYFDIPNSFKETCAYILAFVAIMVIGGIISTLLHKIPTIGLLGILNKLIGGVCGFIISSIVIGYIGLFSEVIIPIKSENPNDPRIKSKFFIPIEKNVKQLHLDEYWDHAKEKEQK